MENNQVKTRINRAVQSREIIEALKNRAKALLNAGYKPSDVAEELHVSAATVLNWFKK